MKLRKLLVLVGIIGLCLALSSCNRNKNKEHDHSYGDWSVTKAATCLEAGESTRKCTICGEKETRTDAIGDHQYSAWNVTTAATCLEVGESMRECTICHATETRVDDITAHNFETVDDQLVCSVCHISEAHYQVILAARNEISIPSIVSGPITLPATIGEVSIAWESSDDDVMQNDGKVYLSTESHDIYLEATFTYMNNSEKYRYYTQVTEISSAVLDNAWNLYYAQQLPETTLYNLKLNYRSYNGVTVLDYSSANQNIITDKGVINQEIEPQTVAITVRFEKDGIIGKYSKNVVVEGFTESQCITAAKQLVAQYVEQIQNGETTTLPTYFEKYGVNAYWSSLDEGVIAGEGVFVAPLSAQDVTINCTIYKKDVHTELSFTLTNIGGNMTEFEQLSQWIKGQLPTRIMGTKNYVYDNDALNYQIRTNSNAVLNLIDGSSIAGTIDKSMFIDTSKTTWKNRFWGSGSLGTIYHPSVTNAFLNEKFFDGYTMPNENNILYIVVHESGMPRTGNDALLLARVQMETAEGTRDRQASWNYQIDENKVYQSFDDNVICWHAGDGTGTPGSGNNNGIGIEMCINDDGNYDGAMYHDAKLIAYLMHKYNLKLENVQRHFDFSGKICPNYMITQGRWKEFLSLVDREYTAMSILAGATVTWTVTTDDNNNTEEVLNQYFTKGASTLWYSKPVSQEVKLNITMKVEINGQTAEASSVLTLYPDEK